MARSVEGLFTWNIETCRVNAKGYIQSGTPVRIKVPKSGTGAADEGA